MSVKQTYIDKRDADIAAAEGLKVDDFVNEAKKKNEANKTKDVKTYSAGLDSQITNTQNYYNKQISDANLSYTDEYERNAVQKLINERQIAQKNANLGLTDSGLNRTQQTAAQLSYANQKANIDLARKNTLESLNLALTEAVTTLQNEKASGIREIESSWDNLSADQGTNAYNNKLDYYNNRINSYNDAISKIEEAEIEAENALIKQQRELEQEQLLYQQKLAQEIELAKIKAAEKPVEDENTKILLYNFTGSSNKDENGTLMLQYTGSDGRNYSVGAGINPYTRSKNAKISKVVDGKCIIDEKWQKDNKNSNNLTVRACANYGVFSNGYQPKGVCYYDGSTLVGSKLEKTMAKDYVNGKLQTVWQDNYGKYWIWDGSINEYREYIV